MIPGDISAGCGLGRFTTSIVFRVIVNLRFAVQICAFLKANAWMHVHKYSSGSRAAINSQVHAAPQMSESRFRPPMEN